jgi:hypothetical protein
MAAVAATELTTRPFSASGTPSRPGLLRVYGLIVDGVGIDEPEIAFEFAKSAALHARVQLPGRRGLVPTPTCGARSS